MWGTRNLPTQCHGQNMNTLCAYIGELRLFLPLNIVVNDLLTHSVHYLHFDLLLANTCYK